MKTRQHHFNNNTWEDQIADLNSEKCQLVLVFGAAEYIIKQEIFQYLRKNYPAADIVLSSTAGEIINDRVCDNSVVATAIELEKTEIKSVKTNINDHKNSFETGNYLKKQLDRDDLSGIFIISDGTVINGSELVEGLSHNNHRNIAITGGMAGDGPRFEKTFTGLNEIPSQGNVIAVGFYGNDILIGHGSVGGWDEFGRERVITRSVRNVLNELDEKNALDLYKQYLGDYANELPGSALLFPLSIRVNGSEKNLIRTILAVDDKEKTMTFAGNVPEGSVARLMKANFGKLIEASSIAATNSLKGIKNQEPELAILMSCIGRKLLLHERAYEEVEIAKQALGNGTTIAGFYSYGEISPFDMGTPCELHNQTMTITTFAETKV